MKITFDVSERLERVALLLVQGDPVMYAELSKIQRRITQIMGAIDNLKQAVDSDVTASQEGFAKFADAIAELTTDIQGLKDKIAAGVPAEEVQAEADRITANAQTISGAFDTVSQQLRDLLPTPAPAPEPEPVPEPGESPANSTEGGGELVEA